jgi:hypothetical protein
MKARSILAFVFLIGLGCLQMIADVAGMPRLKALAAATQVSPAMKVFTAHDRYETHAAKFLLTWNDPTGATHELALTPAVYRNVRGPYNRRNVYGAALAYGPLLRASPHTRRMQESVMNYAFCAPGALLGELGIPIDARNVRAQVIALRPPQRTDLVTQWEVTCHD